MTRSRDVADTQDNLGGAVAPFVAGKNAVINGGFDIWQRGTSIALTNGTGRAYTCDRWTTNPNGKSLTISRQPTNDSTNLPNIQYCARVQRNSGETGVLNTNFLQPIETTNSIPFVGKTVTLSFYARKGANYSSTSNALTAALVSGTGTDQNPLNSYTGASATAETSFTLTSTWQRFTISGNTPTTATEFYVNFAHTPVGTAGADDYFEITGVQLELGSVATPFARAGGSIGGELALCQRYYERRTATDAFNTFAAGSGQSTTAAWLNVNTKVTLRAAPTSIEFSNLGIADGTNAAIAVTGLVVQGTTNGTNSFNLVATVAASGVQYRPYYLLANNSSSAYVAWSSEL
jgi:hypothetical protein